MIDISLNTLIFVTILMAIILFILFFYLLLQKKKEQDEIYKRRKLKEKLRPTISAFLFGEGEVQSRLIQKSIRGYEAICEILEEYRSVMKERIELTKLQAFAETQLGSYFEKQLHHKRWSIRMNTLYRIELFHMKMFEKRLLDMLETGEVNSTETYQVMRVLASFNSSKLQEILFTTQNVWPRFIYREMLRRFDEEVLFQGEAVFNELPYPFQAAIMDRLTERKDYNDLVFVEQQLQSKNLEIRVAALKIIPQIGFIYNYDLLETFSRSAFFQERLMFARVVKVLKKERFKTILVVMLADSNWWVRNAAAEALKTYQDGEFILEYASENHKDQFARDMARQWRNDGDVYE
ncbi:HEAT repeat domain-containing protein [Bacillus alkalicellulosilyticus]|uniref:HEAT repeat domain-containing protein n=1 Tax=Alkalihalobacterium alkalicellulosilyticum TaxID=1912214 RepID=UPI0009980888|nr:HEAT repeat domain-containing protein [Bacillus alkalicellulosilyticus]